MESEIKIIRGKPYIATFTEVPTSPVTWIPITADGASGDGTDETTKMQSVLSRAGAGSVVTVPSNKVFETTGLWVPENVTLLCDGVTSEFKLRNNSLLPAITLSAGAKLVGGLVDGNRYNNSSSQARGVLISGSGAEIQGTEVTNTYSYGIQVTDSDNVSVDAYVHDTRDIGIFVMSDTRECTSIRIRGIIDRRVEGAEIVGGGVQVYGEVFKYSNIDIDCEVLLPLSPLDENACCIIVNGRVGATIRGITDGGQMGITCDSISDPSVRGLIKNASLYGLEFSNSYDFKADGVKVYCNGLTSRAGITANRNSTGNLSDVSVSNPVGGAPCINLHTSTEIGVHNPKLYANQQTAMIAFNDSSRCSVMGGTLKDSSGLCNALLLYSQFQDVSDNNCVGVNMFNIGTVIRMLALTSGKFADRNAFSSLNVVGKPTGSTGAFLQSANGGLARNTHLGESKLFQVSPKIQSLGATGTYINPTWN